MSGAVAAMIVGGVNFAPVTRTYTSGTGATETIPSGASQVIIEKWDGGGGGGGGQGIGCAQDWGMPGGSGSYEKKTLSLASANWGQTFTYTVSLGGAAATNASTGSVTNGTFPTSVALASGPGEKGGPLLAGGGGGLAGGGDTNTNGNNGTGGTPAGATAIVGDLSDSAGAGGSTGFGAGNAGAPGAAGKIKFRYT